jgi:hypothetical protein
MRALKATHCVDRSARTVGMSRESAYRLRRRKGAESFAAAWDAILAACPRGTTSLALQWHRLVRRTLKADPSARRAWAARQTEDETRKSLEPDGRSQ